MRFSLPLQFKDVNGAGRFAGYAAAFKSVDLGGDSIAPGAFTATIAQHKARGRAPALLWSHDASAPIGVVTAMQEDATGLYTEAALTLGTQLADEAHTLLKSGAVSGLSIGFQVPPGGSDFSNGVRLLKAVDVLEISLVAIPMHPDARVTEVKSLKDCQNPAEVEILLRETFRLSSRESKRVASAAWSALSGRHDDTHDDTEILAAFRRGTNSLNQILKGNN